MSRTKLDLRRHYAELSEKEADEVVLILADLIITYLKKGSGSAGPTSAAAPVHVRRKEVVP
jgi:hypothetical protein